MCRITHPHSPGYTLLLIILFLLSRTMFGEGLAAKPFNLIIADGTPVKLRLNQTISSKHAHIGDRLKFFVTSDVTADGLTVIPAGSAASGTIVGVKGKRFLGIGGHVIFTLDSVELANGKKVGLMARKEVKGRSHTKRMAAGIIGTSLLFWPAAFAFLVTRGHDSVALKGTALTGHVEDDVLVQTADLPRTRDTGSQLRDVMSFVPPRVLNGEGLEGDMVNVLFVAQPADLQSAFQRGGWSKVDKSKLAIVWHLLRHVTHNTKLPMARLYLFGRVQDYSYALPDPAAIVSRRHHLRVWKTDYEIDGNPVWAAAAIHDVAIEIGKRSHLISHRIDPNVDAERDFVGENLARAGLVNYREYVHGVDPVFEAQTDDGQAYYSDSRILLLDLRQTMRSQGNRPSSMAVLPSTAPTMALKDKETAALDSAESR